MFDLWQSVYLKQNLQFPFHFTLILVLQYFYKKSVWVCQCCCRWMCDPPTSRRHCEGFGGVCGHILCVSHWIHSTHSAFLYFLYEAVLKVPIEGKKTVALLTSCLLLKNIWNELNCGVSRSTHLTAVKVDGLLACKKRNLSQTTIELDGNIYWQKLQLYSC